MQRLTCEQQLWQARLVGGQAGQQAGEDGLPAPAVQVPEGAAAAARCGAARRRRSKIVYGVVPEHGRKPQHHLRIGDKSEGCA